MGQNLHVIYAKRYVRGKEVESKVLGYVYGTHHSKASSEFIRDHALEQDIDVLFHVSIMLNMEGQVARQFKRSAPKTCWVYFVEIEIHPNIGTGFTTVPEF